MLSVLIFHTHSPALLSQSLILAEEERIVQFVLTEEDEIVDCLAARRKFHLLENLMEEIERFELTGLPPDNVEYVEQRLDVGWYGRRCRKVKRDQLRDIEVGQSALTDSLAGEIADTRWVDLGVPGTHFCSRQTPAFALSETNLGDQTTVDTCCLNLWSCQPSPVHPLQPLGWSQGALNPLLWPVWRCECLAQFLACLRDSDTTLGLRLAEVWAQHGSYCSSSHRTLENCQEYNTWFSHCKSGNTSDILKINKFSDK